MFPTTFPPPNNQTSLHLIFHKNSLELRGTGGTVRGGVDEVLFAASSLSSRALSWGLKSYVG